MVLSLQTSCEKIIESPVVSIKVTISDESGNLNDCNIRIIEPDPDYWNNVYSNMVRLPGSSSHEFKDVEPGNYASLIGNIKETYSAFSAEAGEKIKITYTYYSSGNITVGNPWSGYYSVPYYKWKCVITK